MNFLFSLFSIVALANLFCYCEGVSSYTHPTDSETKIRHIRRRDEVRKVPVKRDEVKKVENKKSDKEESIKPEVNEPDINEGYYYDDESQYYYGDNTHPTIVTNYIGRWSPVAAHKNMYVFAGFGSTINTEDERLSSKKLERMIGYGYKNHDADDYTVYFEVIPHDGSYWHLLIHNLTMEQYKYTVVYDYTGGIFVWGSPSHVGAKI